MQDWTDNLVKTISREAALAVLTWIRQLEQDQTARVVAAVGETVLLEQPKAQALKKIADDLTKVLYS